MSQEAWPPPAVVDQEPRDRTSVVREGLTSLAVVVAWFAVAALIAAVVWWQVTPLAEYTRTADNATMDEEQLAKQFGTDGWFFVVAAAAGLLSGFLLLLVRRVNPVLMVLLVTLGGGFATYVMLEAGRVLGPSDPASVLATTPVGATVPLQLVPEAHGVWFVWSIAALLGAIVALWVLEARDSGSPQPVTAPGAYPNPPMWTNDR